MGTILVTSSILLTFASGYTTFCGLLEYVQTFIAVLVTIGIQGLLFASSWRLGAGLLQNFKISVIFIFFITMIVSVFFSYSDLLNKMFSPEDRRRLQIERATEQASNIIYDVRLKIEDELNQTTSSIKSDFEKYNQEQNIAIKKSLTVLNDDINKTESKYKEFERLFKREVENGGTSISANQISKPGYGNISKDYENKYQTIYDSEYLPKKRDVEHLEKIIANNIFLANSVKNSHNTLLSENIRKYRENIDQYGLKLKSDFEITNVGFPSNINNNINYIIRLNEFNLLQKEECNIKTSFDLSVVKHTLNECVSLAPIEPPEQKREILHKINKIGLSDGDKVHYFLLSINELTQKNILAFGALFIALSMDGLILFCGILASRPESYLNMKSVDDLIEVQEQALQTVFEIKFDETFLKGINSRYIRHLINILSNCVPDMELAYQGIPVVMRRETIESMNLGRELGTLIALKLAEIVNDGKDVGLRTRFIIWASDQITSYLEKEENLSSFHKTFAKEANA
ncbi:MAG TPA: hypothetical protein DEG92_02645 [Rikenellaceae bacterium]|nr:hypothetical protein [Rikenellaceae bacterium]